MPHKGKNKGLGWIGARTDDQDWYKARVKKQRVRNKQAKSSRKQNRSK